MRVADVKNGGNDSAGAVIREVYLKQPPHYAIYRTPERVLVHYADDEDEAKRQAATLAPLNPARGEINGLIDGWHSSDRGSVQAKAKRYSRRVADALGVALEGDASGSLAVLTSIKADLVDERTSWARFQYLIAAALVAVVVVLVTAIIGAYLTSGSVRALWLALAGGTVGALFSIAIAIRQRTVLTDLHFVSNTADAVLRVVIGAIAAAVLVSLVELRAVVLTIGDANLADNTQGWLFPLVVAFVGGFSERLVPDLLERSRVGAAGPALRQPATVGATTTQASTQAATVSAAGEAIHDYKSAEDEDRLHDCLCDSPTEAHEATADVDLPPATGGVASAQAPAAAVPGMGLVVPPADVKV